MLPKEAAVLLYSPGTDTFLEDLTRNADRVFYLDDGPRATVGYSRKREPILWLANLILAFE